VVEFVSQRATGKVQLPAGILAWDIQRSPDPFEDTQGGIRAREELLRSLPESLEALSTKVELHASIGHLHWSGGDLGKAATEFERGMTLAKDYELPELRPACSTARRRCIRRGPSDALGASTRAAISILSRAAINLSANTACWARQGALHGQQGRGQIHWTRTRGDVRYIQNAAGKPDMISRQPRRLSCATPAIAYRTGCMYFLSTTGRQHPTQQGTGAGGRREGT
jgi:hypothetical protein